MNTLRTSDFSFEFPESLIAQYPLAARQDSRLLVVDREKHSWQHETFQGFLSSWAHWERKPLLVLNNTLVLPVRFLLCDQKGRSVEILITNPLNKSPYSFLTKPLKKRFVGETFSFPTGDVFEILSLGKENLLAHHGPSSLSDLMTAYGHLPLPPYFKRLDEKLDEDRYQTVYAQTPGSLAAPTAGLHFSQEFLSHLNDVGVESVFLTLHVGLGTFQPVRSNEPCEHNMHKEFFEVPEQVQSQILKARKEKRPIVAVGTTSFRALESFFAYGKKKETNLFVYPKTRDCLYHPAVVDALLTNFHQPQSTLVMLMAALMGYDLWKKVYDDAVESQYRLFSYGDANLIWLRSPQIFSSKKLV
jgi:S-adenosylmethionine:tRNA ribosyltransferase-isomerase